MVNKDIIIKLVNDKNFKDMILICLENDIDFTDWYSEISIHAPECTINYSILEKEVSFYHFSPDDENLSFWIPSGVKNELIKLTGAYNFYKYFYKIFKFESGNYIFDVKPTKALNDRCLKNWYVSSEDDFFGIDYNMHGRSFKKKSEDVAYFANGEQLNEIEIKQYLLNKKLNKIKGKKTEPKKYPKKKIKSEPKPKPKVEPPKHHWATWDAGCDADVPIAC